jgi:hypothetical protein
VLLFAVGAVLFLPAIRAPLFLDDYNQAAMAHGAYPAPRGPLDLYDFVGARDRRALLDRGVLPWWTDAHLSVRFLRPLSSALLWLDYRVAKGSALLGHLHSLAWWMAAVLAALALYRRHLSFRAAVLATCILALAPCHAVPLAWLANREALVALALGALALGAYVRWREDRGTRNAAIAAALFAATLAAGEYGVCFVGYVVAFEATVRGERIRQRLSGLLPAAVPVAIYVVLHQRLRYGALGLGFYSDPLRDPPAFARAVPRHLATLLVDGWLSGAGVLPWWGLALAAVSLCAALGLVARNLDGAGRRTLLWMLAGSILALLPVLATLPSPRLLGVSMLGIAGVLGVLLDRAFPIGGAGGALVKAVALGAAVAHLALGPAASRLAARSFQAEAAKFAARAESLRGVLAGRTAEQIVVLRSIGAEFTLPFMADAPAASPRRFRVLTQAGHIVLKRRDARTLDVFVAEDRALFPPGPANLVRDPNARVKAGEVFRASGMRATVLDVGVAGPRAARFEFDSDLGGAEVACIVEAHDGFHEVRLPEPGYGAALDP